MSLKLSLDPAGLEDKDISIGDDTDGEEAVQYVDKISIRRCNETDKGPSRLAKNVLSENRNCIANTKTTVNGDEFVDESGIAIVEDVSEERSVDKQDSTDGEDPIHLVSQ